MESSKNKGKGKIQLLARGLTDAGDLVAGGVFGIFDTHGIPLADMLNALKNNEIVVDWAEFIQDGFLAGWKEKTLLIKLREAVIDAFGLDYWNTIDKKFQDTLTIIYKGSKANIVKEKALQYEIKDGSGEVVGKLNMWCDAVKYKALLTKLEEAEAIIEELYGTLSATMLPEQRIKVLAKVNEK